MESQQDLQEPLDLQTTRHEALDLHSARHLQEPLDLQTNRHEALDLHSTRNLQEPLDLQINSNKYLQKTRHLQDSDFLNHQEPEFTVLTNASFSEEDSSCSLSESANFTICSSFHVLNPATCPMDTLEDTLDFQQDLLMIKEEPHDFDSDYSQHIHGEPELYMSDLWPVDNTISIETNAYRHNDDVFTQTADVKLKSRSKIPSVCSDSDSSDSIDEKSERKKPGRKKGQVSKVLHLWEFMRDLLKNPEYCGKIIKWEDKSRGIFRIVKSSAVAGLWGAKKKNKKVMTYEKMSRSIRYSRREGYFGSVPREKTFPRKLCFKFGDKATDWQ